MIKVPAQEANCRRMSSFRASVPGPVPDCGSVYGNGRLCDLRRPMPVANSCESQKMLSIDSAEGTVRDSRTRSVWRSRGCRHPAWLFSPEGKWRRVHFGSMRAQWASPGDLARAARSRFTPDDSEPELDSHVWDRFPRFHPGERP